LRSSIITLDTPHLGSQFATILYNSGPICTLIFNAIGYKVAGAVHDLEYQGSFIQTLLVNKYPLKAHVIAGEATPQQEAITEAAILASQASLSNLCIILPLGGFPQVFATPADPNGYSDLIVSVVSQLGESDQIDQHMGISVSGEVPPGDPPFIGIEHLEGIPLFFPGPAPSDPLTPIPQRVIDLLNTWIGTSNFGDILP
jgi:hypothetical protein